MSNFGMWWNISLSSFIFSREKEEERERERERERGAMCIALVHRLHNCSTAASLHSGMGRGP
jgi:hypothetical protein